MAVTKQVLDDIADVLLPSADRRQYSLRSALGDRKCLALVFTSVHCPYAKAYFDVLRDHARTKVGRRVGFLLVAANRSAARYPEGLITLRRKFGAYPLPFVRDSNHILAKALRPATTPSAFVIDRRMRVQYRGAIDDRFKAPGEFAEGIAGFWPWDGSKRWVPSAPYLMDALASVLKDEAVKSRSSEIGCAINL